MAARNPPAERAQRFGARFRPQAREQGHSVAQMTNTGSIQRRLSSPPVSASTRRIRQEAIRSSSSSFKAAVSVLLRPILRHGLLVTYLE
jgi:hypothetical protein